MQKNSPDAEVVLLEASGESNGGGGAPDNGKGGAPPAAPAPTAPAQGVEMRKDAPLPPMERLKALLAEIQGLVKVAEGGGTGKVPPAQPAPAPAAAPLTGELEKKVADLEAVVKRISGALSLGTGTEEVRLQGGAPSIPEVVAGLAKRLEALEKQPGQRSSLEGQEPLPGEGKKRSIWKGAV